MFLSLLLSLWLLPSLAQTEIEVESDSIDDTLTIDTLQADSVSMPWPQSIA